MPGEDLHLSDLACSQAHSPGVHAWGTIGDLKLSLLQEAYHLASAAEFQFSRSP